MPYNFAAPETHFKGSELAYKINVEFVPYAIQIVVSTFHGSEGGNNCIAWGGFERCKGNHPVHTPMLVAMVMWSSHFC